MWSVPSALAASHSTTIGSREWVENYYGNSVVDMQVLPSFENLLSVTGYLGKNGTTDNNGNMVFPYFQNFEGLSSLPSGYSTTDSSGIQFTDNGIILTAGSVYSDFTIPSVYRQFYGEFTAISGGNVYEGITLANTQSPQSGNSGSNYEQLYIYASDTTLSAWGGTGSTASYNVADNVALFTPVNGVPYGLTITYSNAGFQYGRNNTILATNSTTIGTDVPQEYVILGQFTGASTGTLSYNPMEISYVFDYNTTPDNIMPTFTIGSPSVFQANATSFNTTHQHYMTFAPYEYNLSEGMYTYSIPDSFDVKYITLYYNASWTLEYASYVYEVGTMESRW